MTMTMEQKAVLALISEALQYKSTDNKVEFYWDSLLKPDLSEHNLKLAFDELIREKVIVRYQLGYEEPQPAPTGSARVSAPTRTHTRAYYTLWIDRKKLDTLCQELKGKYWVDITKTREVIVNDEFIVGRPHFASENHDFIEFAIAHPNTAITKDALKAANLTIHKKFAQIINDLGFEDELQKAFFPNTSLKAVEFRNHLTDDDLKKYKVDEHTLNEQLRKLPKVEKIRKESGRSRKK